MYLHINHIRYKPIDNSMLKKREIIQKIDARGRVCPLPLFYVKQKIEKMQIGDEVEIIIDDITAKDTIPRWSMQHGHEIVSIEDSGDNQFRIIIMKK